MERYKAVADSPIAHLVGEGAPGKRDVSLPMITLRNKSIQQLSQDIYGNRNDENCGLKDQRAALMRMKANRLGDNGKARESETPRTGRNMPM